MKSPLNIKEKAYEKQNRKMRSEYKSETGKTLGKRLTKGVSKSKIQSSFGDPDRKGKFSNGDELWGFKNYTLKFDKNGKLKNWSKPFVN